MSAIMFDLDGTLIDSNPDLHAAASAMLEELSLPPLSLAEAREYIGDGMQRFVKRTLTRQWWGEPSPALLARAEERMRHHYASECTARCLVYDGVPETLDTLKNDGMQLACVTNKPERFTHPVLQACGLDRFFGAVISGDSLPTKKPSPEPLREACRRLGQPCEGAWFVGDSKPDADAAAAAKCRFIVVSYGYHRNGRLPRAEQVVHRFKEILQTVRGECHAGIAS